MISIGIRVTPREIFYSLIEKNGEEYQIISISSIKVPQALDAPCKLSFIRNTLDTIIKQYKVNRAGIKLIEGNARTAVNASTFFRLNLEGVIQEIFANSTVEEYMLGVAANIASRLNIESKPVSKMVEDLGIDDSYTTDEGRKLKDENKESLVVGIAVLN